ncbi:phage tail protein I [Vibrio aestuarianus]|uniref:phage tail protein I n=1 Tax=Vibrio aestuarianus TaxID=28171 RepID=UPI001593ACD0|nr:phage tail protein I [Vibrio aestuarianus]NGZ17563.1 phage tail protein I [Vibrio aestuarianus]
MSQSTSESKPSSYSLLTDNASPLERALERTLSKHLDQVAPPLPQLRNAHQTPESALPHLAADRMVTYWKKEDSVKIKRSQVASAQVERKLSGTKDGVRIALDAIGYGCEIKSQYESPDLPPFTLDVVAWKTDSSPVNKDLINQLIGKLDDIKSTRDTVELSLVFGVSASFPVKAARAPSVSLLHSKAEAQLWEPINGRASVAVGLGCIPAVIIQPISAKAVLIPSLPEARLSFGSGVSPNPISVTHIYATARTS